MTGEQKFVLFSNLALCAVIAIGMIALKSAWPICLVVGVQTTGCTKCAKRNKTKPAA